MGKNGDLPWSLPGDLKQFKEKTVGKPVVMGRTTYESLGRALPHRPNIVVSRNPLYRVSDAKVVTTLDAALAIADEEAKRLRARGSSPLRGAPLFSAKTPPPA